MQIPGHIDPVTTGTVPLRGGNRIDLVGLTRDAIGGVLVEAGLEPTAEAVADPANRPAVHEVTKRLLAVAEPYYDSARDGLRGLPFRSSMAIAAARGVYREIGRKVRRRGPGVWVKRVSVGKPMKLWLFGRGALIAVWTQVLDRGKSPPVRPGLWTRV